MHLPAFLQIKTALPCRATWLDIRDVITALALHSASSRACCGRCLRCFSPPLPALAILWLGQSNQIVCEASAALLYCQAITPTQCTPYHQVRMSVRSPQESLRPELRASAEQNRPTAFRAALFPAILPLGCHAANSSTRMPSHACQTPIRQTT